MENESKPKSKKMKYILYGILGLFVFGLIIRALTPQSELDRIEKERQIKDSLALADKPRQDSLKAISKRKSDLAVSFSSYDGSNRYLEKFIKKNMNDPASYEHVKTVYSDEKDYLLVQTQFRGKNKFGALVLQNVTAKVSIDGSQIEIVSAK